jgi:hypothetical protein
VRQGHHHGNGGHGGHSASGTKGTMKTKRAVGDGPEADWSGPDDEDDCISIVDEEVVPVGEPVGKSAQKSEVSMHTLLDGAKLRPGKLRYAWDRHSRRSPCSALFTHVPIHSWRPPIIPPRFTTDDPPTEPQNISRGYELLTSPASRLVIPFDAVPSSPTKPFATRTGTIFGGAGYGVCSMPSSPGFSDDLEWEWEDLCFEMDGVDLTKGTATVKGKKDAYAEVVKRAAV